VGEDGQTHHGQFDLTYLRSLPNMTVMAPKDENELRHMLFTALSLAGPVAIRYPRGRGLGVPLDPEYKSLPVGESELLREGRDLTLIGLGSMVHACVEAAVHLEKEGLSAAVVNGRFAKPLDPRLAEYAGKTGRVLVVEENIRQGGLGSAVLELFSDAGLTNVVVKRLGLPDSFIEHGPVEVLKEKLGLDKAGIVKAAKALLAIG
jgi:1-deoxy-D-xylulose-5-phosphate synthase